MKQVTEYYSKNSSPVVISFLDASKAFDRLNHWSLFKKLVYRGVPLYVVRILVFWYSTQNVFVQWGKVMSSGFHVSNGVRQGGIMSPLLFNVYMDDLSRELQTLPVGCCMSNCLINHLFYADDACLLSPSGKGVHIAQ